MAPSQASGLLLESKDLPNGWSQTTAPHQPGAPFDPTGIWPDTCASSWADLDRVQQDWSNAPVAVNAAFRNTNGALLVQAITDDPNLDPASLRARLERLIDHCDTYKPAQESRSDASGHIDSLDLRTSGEDIGLTQAETLPDGTSRETQFAYMFRGTRVITLHAGGTGLSEPDFLNIAQAADAKATWP